MSLYATTCRGGPLFLASRGDKFRNVEVDDGFPNEHTTGVQPGITLQRVPQDVSSGTGWSYDGNFIVNISGAGAVFQNYYTSNLTVNVLSTATNATIRNCIIEVYPADYGIQTRSTTNLTIDHCTLRGSSRTQSTVGDNAIRGINGDDTNITITNNNIYWVASGINHFDAGGLIEGNYIHDIGFVCPGGDPDCGHFNGIQLGAGTGPLMTINHNTVLNPAIETDCIMLSGDDGAQTNRTITNNLLGGGAYPFYGSASLGATATNIVFTGNKFTTRYYPSSGFLGPVANWQAAQSGNVFSNNTWADGPLVGQTVPSN